MWHCVYMNKARRSEELHQHQHYLTLTYLNVVWSDVKGCHQALQEISDSSEVGASNAPGAVHQQHDVCCCIAVTLKWFPWRHTLINRSMKQIVLKGSEFRDLLSHARKCGCTRKQEGLWFKFIFFFCPTEIWPSGGSFISVKVCKC